MANHNLEVTRLSEEHMNGWNNFIKKSKNGTFLFLTNYLLYHQERFENFSLIVKKKNSIAAVMPANISGSTLYSHQGLTYGGLIILPNTKISDVIEYFNAINRYLLEHGIEKVIYKKVPAMYSQYPAEEDEYALFRLGARIIGGGISSVIDLSNKIPYSKLRIRQIKRAQEQGLKIRINSEVEQFWEILANNLRDKYQTTPVHSIQEIKKLQENYPDYIKLFTAHSQEQCLAGVVIYQAGQVAHAQYISANDDGKKSGALDLLFHYLITEYEKKVRYFDFGTSVEENGHYLNEGLIEQKQGFGARAFLYRTYEYDTSSIINNREKRHD